MNYYSRKCDCCGKGMEEGFLLGGGFPLIGKATQLGYKYFGKPFKFA